MSHGCGTLSSPSGLKKGNAAASSGKDGPGKQHSLPTSPYHGPPITFVQCLDHFDVKQSTSKTPTRLWGQTKGTRWKGEQRPDGTSEHWLEGEFWNCDSNIRKWGEHEVRRNAASSNHDVHRHDQITRAVLQPQPSKNGREQQPRMCLSGVVAPDSCFLEAWGFDLGNRDRQGNICSTFKPVSKSEHFRATRSFSRNTERIADNFRTMRKTASSPGTIQMQTLRPEDISGDAGISAEKMSEMSHSDDTVVTRAGRTHGSRSCKYWDSWDHACRREATKMSCGVHGQASVKHRDDHPYKDNLELSPAAIYTKKFQRGGEDALRAHVGAKSQRLQMS